MADVEQRHFLQSALEIGAHGDNDTLPYDIDDRFVGENAETLSGIAFQLYSQIDEKTEKDARKFVDSLQVFSERLLVPTGSAGFRITTKIHPFWTLYLNGLGLAVAEKNEPLRSHRAHSYRLGGEEPSFFDRARSWSAYKEATLADPALQQDGAVVIQTDISSFYEQVYHHRLENCVKDLLPYPSTIAVQMARFLITIASGRSFGLPVGSQFARILAEVMMSSIDQSLSDNEIIWHRYVDDFILVCSSQQDAYRALSVLSHALADYGLSLNRTKTTILSGKHYRDYVDVQLGRGDDVSTVLRKIDLYFDPYSDTAASDYAELKRTVSELDVEFLLDLERNKSQSDSFIVAQISRTIKFHDLSTAVHLCTTLLDPTNLNAVRASWSNIMRGISAVRGNPEFGEIFDEIDRLLDGVIVGAPHLLLPEANVLHYLRAIRFRRTDARGLFLRRLYDASGSETVKRGCIECRQQWRDRSSFNRVRNQWQAIGPEEQRMLWLASGQFGDEGLHARNQVRRSLPQAWRLGFEGNGAVTVAEVYSQWAENVG